MAHRICRRCRSLHDLRERVETIAHEREIPLWAQLHPMLGLLDGALHTTHWTRRFYQCGRCLRRERVLIGLVIAVIFVIAMMPAAAIFLREGPIR